MGTPKRESDPGRVELRRAAGKFGPSRADDIFTWPPWVAPMAIHVETLRVSGRGLHSARMKLPSTPQGSASPSPPPRRLRLVRYACRLRGNLAGHRPTSRRNWLVTFSDCVTLCRRDAPPVTNAARTRSDYISPDPPGRGAGRALPPKPFGLRREAQRHAALATRRVVQKRCRAALATAVQSVFAPWRWFGSA